MAKTRYKLQVSNAHEIKNRKKVLEDLGASQISTEKNRQRQQSILFTVKNINDTFKILKTYPTIIEIK